MVDGIFQAGRPVTHFTQNIRRAVILTRTGVPPILDTAGSTKSDVEEITPSGSPSKTDVSISSKVSSSESEYSSSSGDIL